MSLGAGFEYLMRSVARGDGGVPGSSPLTRYYLESGTPAGVWLGRGLAGLADGDGVEAGSIVSEEGLWRLLGMLADPVTGIPLGRAPQHSRVGAPSRAVAGFDLTFSVPKSVSVLWALADAPTQQVIHQAHRDAIALALAWAEDNVVFTRTGAGGRVQERVRGLVCAAFDHWDSRSGDPHLHTHVVVANRVQTDDGVWRTLDGAALFRYTVALSELHEGLVHDLLTERLGVTWSARARAHSVVPRWDLDGIPTALMEAFSTRSAAIAADTEQLVAEFVAAHGRHPSGVEVLKLRQRATLATRPDKQQAPLAQRMLQWRRQAGDLVDIPVDQLVAAVLHRGAPPASDTGVQAAEIDAVARSVLAAAGGKKAVFTEANVLAETHRQLHGHTFRSARDRLVTAQLVTAAALDHALLLDDPTAARLLHRGTARYTTPEILDAETRLLNTARTLDAPTLDPATLDPATIAAAAGTLGADQAAAITAIACSGRSLDLLIGPAGSGKTTTLAALKSAWEQTYGPGSVTGLAPSAAAAQVLADELGIAAENTAKWLTEHDRNPERHTRIAQLTGERAACRSSGSVLARRLTATLLTVQRDHDHWTVRPGQLLIIDEASLAGTITLDRITTAAHTAGAKILLVGDPAQLGAIDAGGAFTMLAVDRPDTPTLSTVHRFHEPWEAQASLELRAGDPAAIDNYLEHERITSGDRGQMLHALFDHWAVDTDAGLTSAMIAPDDDTVRQLNALAQAHHRDTGRAAAATVPLADGHVAGVGDRILTRRNDRRLRTSSGGWVKNGDTWTITDTHPDGSLTVTRDNGVATTLQLPADYVAEHVELGYATTIHRAQGSTVDTAHALIDHRATREALYVAATRARDRNDLYIDTAGDHEADIPHRDSESSVAEVLRAVLVRTADTSAHAAAKQTEPSATPATAQAVAAGRRWASSDLDPTLPTLHA